MGVTIREKIKGSGEWWVFIRHQGRRTSKKVGPKRLAQQAAEVVQAKLVLGDFNLEPQEQAGVPLLKDYAQLWLEDYVSGLRRATTYERYRANLRRYILPELGGKPIDQITRGDVRNLLLKQHKRGLSTSTIGLIRNVVSGIMGYALDEEIISVNPVLGITKKLGLDRDKKAKVDPFTHEEVNQFLETCAKHYPEHYPLFLCSFRTGMRLGELLGLRWDDIDWHGKFIHVQRSFRHGRITPTKSGRTRRVDMSDQLVGALKRLYTIRKKEALEQGQGQVVETVFHIKNLPMAQNSARNHFKRILRKAGLRKIRFHDIRHTYASLLLSHGQSPVYVKEQLGHSSIQITVDIYGHLIPGSNREAVNQLDSNGWKNSIKVLKANS